MLTMTNNVVIATEYGGTVVLSQKQFRQAEFAYTLLGDMHEQKFDKDNRAYYQPINKVPKIKMMRGLFDLNLSEAKHLVDYLDQESK